MKSTDSTEQVLRDQLRERLTGAGWKEMPGDRWENTRVFSYPAPTGLAPSKDGKTAIPANQSHVVPAGLTVSLDEAVELELKRPKAKAEAK